MFISMFIVIIGARMMESLIVKNTITLCNNQGRISEFQNDTIKQIAVEWVNKIRKIVIIAWLERDLCSSYRGLR